MMECSCPTEGDTPLWSCRDTTEHVTDEPSMDQSTAINDLDATQQEAWCDWFSGIYHPVEPGFPAQPVLPADEDGYYPNSGCLSGDPSWFFMAAKQPTNLPTPACVDNLALSTCTLPLSSLTDCVRSMRMQWPQPHGCAVYLDTPGCNGTIITTRSDCHVKVE
jgi:hypothetical protein